MLTGDRIVLRAYAESDAPGILAWRNDPRTTRWMGRKFRTPPSMEEVSASLQRAMEAGPESLFFAIARKSNGSYLGGIDLTDIDPIDCNAVLSMVIGEEANRGCGLGTEALMLLLGHAFGVLGLHRVWLRVHEANVGGRACYGKCGFKEEGRFRDQVSLEGQFGDLILMGILASEFDPALAGTK